MMVRYIMEYPDQSIDALRNNTVLDFIFLNLGDPEAEDFSEDLRDDLDDLCDILSESLRESASLKSLTYDARSYRDYERLAVLLQSMRQITSLDVVDHRNQNLRAPVEAADGALRGHPSLEKLSVNWTSPQGYNSFSSSLSGLRKLRSVQMQGDDGNTTLLVNSFPSIRDTPSLAELRIESITLDGQCNIVLIDTIANNPQLEELKIETCHTTGENSAALCKELARTSLRILELSCPCSSEFYSALAHAAKTIPCLSRLALRARQDNESHQNCIHSLGLQCVINGINVADSLMQLELTDF